MKTRVKTNRLSIFILFLLFIIIILSFKQGNMVSASEPMLEEWQEFSQNISKKKQLIDWLKCKAKAKMTGTDCLEKLTVAAPQYYGKVGIFITLKKGKNVRGCYGAFSHTSTDIAAVLSDYLSGALTLDPRYKPLGISELERTEIILTITSQPYVVADAESVDVLRYGIALTCADGITIVYVPAEIRDTRLILKQTKQNDCQVSAFRTVTIK